MEDKRKEVYKMTNNSTSKETEFCELVKSIETTAIVCHSNRDMGMDLGCPQSGSTGDNWKMFENDNLEHNSNDILLLQELKTAMGLPLPQLKMEFKDQEKLINEYLSNIEK